MQLFRLCLLFPMFVSPALAADADNGKRLAEARCVTCHMVAPSPRREVADAPPFDVIARKYQVQPETLAFAILDPHPRMNVALSRRGGGRYRGLYQHARKIVGTQPHLPRRECGDRQSVTRARGEKNRAAGQGALPLGLRALGRRCESDRRFAPETSKGVELLTLLARLAAQHRDPAERTMLNARSRLGGHCREERLASLPRLRVCKSPQ